MKSALASLDGQVTAAIGPSTSLKARPALRVKDGRASLDVPWSSARRTPPPPSRSTRRSSRSSAIKENGLLEPAANTYRLMFSTRNHNWSRVAVRRSPPSGNRRMRSREAGRNDHNSVGEARAVVFRGAFSPSADCSRSGRSSRAQRRGRRDRRGRPWRRRPRSDSF